MTDPAKVLFRNASYDGQLVRTLAAATVGSADLGEAMATARRVGKPSGVSWHDAWLRTAEAARRTAAEAQASGERISARHAYLRASEYYRQAYYFVRSNLDDRRLQEAYRAHVDTFRAAVALMEHPAEPVRIPYEDTTLAGYLYAPDASGTARPTVVFPCGYDSTAEAGWVNVPAALGRGYNALVFEGPGQGEALFTQRLYFRADFEAVLTPVLDWLLTRPEVNPDAVVLVGRSFAGYLAPRAAAFEHRLAALVCDPAQPDMAARLPDGLAGKLAPAVVRAQMRMSGDRAEFFGARMAAHGIADIDRYFAELRRFNMLDQVGQITCPTLIVEADHDFAGGSGRTLCDRLTVPAQLVPLTAAQGADGHCAGLGQQIWAETVYGWLRATLPSAPNDPTVPHPHLSAKEQWTMTTEPHVPDLASLPRPDQEAITATLISLLAGFSERDADKLIDVYSHDADWVNAFGSVKHGRDEIVAYLRGLFADDNFNAGTLKAPPESHIRVLNSEVVLVSTHLQVEGQKLLDGGVITERDNRSLRVLQRRPDGTWPIVSEMYMDANREQSYAGHS